jgi:cell division protease FtsH
MVTEYGMSSLGPIQYENDSSSVFLGRDYTSVQKNFSTQIAYEIDTEVRKIIDEAHQEAHRVLTEHKEDVILLAETLLEKETIAAEEIQYLLEHRQLPNGKNGKNGKSAAPAPEAEKKDAEEGKA